MELKKSYPGYSDRIDKMILVAEEIIDSKDPFEPINKIVPTLDAIDAYILGMITGEIIKYTKSDNKFLNKGDMNDR